jgi:hypothetical protein
MRLATTAAALLCLVVLAGCGSKKEKPPKESNPPAQPPTQPPTSTLELLPADKAVVGWSLVEPGVRCVGDELYGPIDGAADKYFAFRFKEAAFAHYKEDAAEVEVQVYQMGSPDDACGIASTYDDVNAEHVTIGDGVPATVSDLNLDFAKGPYYVRVLSQAGDATRDELAAFARGIAQRIPQHVGPPKVRELLPEGAVAGGVTYFRTQNTQADLFYLADDNLLGLSDETFGVSACYGTKTTEAGTKQGTDALFVIVYPTEEAALDAFQRASEFFGDEPYRLFGVPGGPEPQLIIDKGDEDFLKIARCRNVLYGAWMIEDVARVNELSKELAARVRQGTLRRDTP